MYFLERKYEVIEFEMELESHMANVGFHESNTRNFCAVNRPDKIRSVCFLEFMETSLDFFRRLKNDYFILGDFNTNILTHKKI